MRANEFITESVTFSVGKLREEDGKKYFSDPWQKKVKKECWACDGRGYDTYPNDPQKYECGYCHGKKEVEEWESDAPEMNVSNGNAMEVLSMLGYSKDEMDYAGIIPQEKLGDVMQRLLRLKNSGKDLQKHMASDVVTGREMEKTGTDGNVTHIGKSGPTMYQFGRTYDQVARYVDTLINMVRFAQQNDATIGWG